MSETRVLRFACDVLFPMPVRSPVTAVPTIFPVIPGQYVRIGLSPQSWDVHLSKNPHVRADWDTVLRKCTPTAVSYYSHKSGLHDKLIVEIEYRPDGGPPPTSFACIQRELPHELATERARSKAGIALEHCEGGVDSVGIATTKNAHDLRDYLLVASFAPSSPDLTVVELAATAGVVSQMVKDHDPTAAGADTHAFFAALTFHILHDLAGRPPVATERHVAAWLAPRTWASIPLINARGALLSNGPLGIQAFLHIAGDANAARGVGSDPEVSERDEEDPVAHGLRLVRERCSGVLWPAIVQSAKELDDKANFAARMRESESKRDERTAEGISFDIRIRAAELRQQAVAAKLAELERVVGERQRADGAEAR